MNDLRNDFAAIEALDFHQIKHKLMHRSGGNAWSAERVDAAEREYRRFLYLMKKYPDEVTAPSMEVDRFWHQHILDTAKYARDCEAVFGYFLHHYPYLGLGGEEDEALRQQAGERMRQIYEETFGDAAPAQQPAFAAGTNTVAYCTITRQREPLQDVAYCTVTQQTAQQRAASAATETGYCTVTRTNNPIDLPTAYCTVTRATGAIGAQVAYCTVTAPRPARPEAMAGSAAEGADTAYCTITRHTGTGRAGGLTHSAAGRGGTQSASDHGHAVH